MRSREIKRLLVIFRRFDAWATLLLGVLVALAVVILFSMPGPWRTVTGSTKPPVHVAASPAANIVVFARGGHGSACTGILWLHVNHDRPSATVVVVDPSTEGFVDGAGFVSLGRALTDVGPDVATDALGRVLGVRMDGYLVLDHEALRLSLEAMTPLMRDRSSLVLRRHALAAWGVCPTLQHPWTSQYLSLTVGVLRLPRHELEIVALANYILGFGHVETNLKLRNVTEIATTVQEAELDRLAVGSVPIVRRCCRGVEAWRADSTGALLLTRSARGEAAPVVRTKKQSAHVLVVACGSAKVGALYRDEVRKSLRRSAGSSVSVALVGDSSWSRAVEQAKRSIEGNPPLAVYVAPPELGSVASAGHAADALDQLVGLLRATGVPVVFSDALPAREMSATEFAAMNLTVGTALRGDGAPVLSSSALLASASSQVATTKTRRACAVAGAAMLVRSCWPEVLAPRLASTRLGFSFARRQRTIVGVVPPAGKDAAVFLARLVPYGYQAVAAEQSGSTLRKKTLVTYHRGMRTAALSLAGDLGLPDSAVRRNDRAPRSVTLVLGAEGVKRL